MNKYTADRVVACGNYIMVYAPIPKEVTDSGIYVPDETKEQAMKKMQVFVEVHSVGALVPRELGIQVGSEVVIAGFVNHHDALKSDREGFTLGLARFMDVMAVYN